MARHYGSTRPPTSPRELAECVADPERFAEMFPNADARAFDEFFDSYSANSPRIAAQVAEQAQLEAARMFRQGGHVPGPAGLDAAGQQSRPGAAALAKRHHLYNSRAPGAVIDSLAKGDPAQVLADMFMAVATSGPLGANMDTPRAMELRNAMSERVPGQGGFLLPEVLRSTLLMAALEQSIVRSRAHIVPMDSLRVPLPTVDDTSHVSSVFGGLTGYWAEEAAALTASAPGFGRTELEAHKLTLYTTLPNELVHDSPLVMDFLQEVLPASVAFYEDVAFITGTGTGQPQGYVNAPAAIQVTRKTASKVFFQDITNMYVRLLPVAIKNAVWICSPNVIGQLLALTMPTGDATTTFVAPPLFLTAGSIAQGAEYTLLGHPLIVTEKAPALGTLGDLSFVNLDYYLLGDRQSMSLETSEHYQFANDLLAVRILERVEGRVWLQSAITPQNGDSTLSPVVLLH